MLIFSESIDSSLSTDMLLNRISKHVQFLAEYSEAPIQTITDYITVNGCAIFGINPCFHIKNTLISELRNL
jgi:hypothetical protein